MKWNRPYSLQPLRAHWKPYVALPDQPIPHIDYRSRPVLRSFRPGKLGTWRRVYRIRCKSGYFQERDQLFDTELQHANLLEVWTEVCSKRNIRGKDIQGAALFDLKEEKDETEDDTIAANDSISRERSEIFYQAKLMRMTRICTSRDFSLVTCKPSQAIESISGSPATPRHCLIETRNSQQTCLVRPFDEEINLGHESSIHHVNEYLRHRQRLESTRSIRQNQICDHKMSTFTM